MTNKSFNWLYKLSFLPLGYKNYLIAYILKNNFDRPTIVCLPICICRHKAELLLRYASILSAYMNTLKKLKRQLKAGIDNHGREEKVHEQEGKGRC